MTRILVFGDSICAGSNIPDGGPADAWPNLVATAAGLEIANRSRGGRPTAALDEFVLAWDEEAAACAPDVLLIALGTNDSRDLSAGMADAAGGRDALKGWALMLALIGIVLVAAYFDAR